MILDLKIGLLIILIDLTKHNQVLRLVILYFLGDRLDMFPSKQIES